MKDDANQVNAVEVVGGLQHVQFPAMCIKCRALSRRTLPVTKLFWRAATTDQPSYYVIGELGAPFCSGCIQAHERERQPIARHVKRQLLRSWFVQSLPYLFPLGVNLWFVGMLAPQFIEALSRGGELWESLIWGGLSAFFGVLAVLFYQAIRRRGRRLILEPQNPSRSRYLHVESGPLGSRFFVPTEPTSTLRALDFTDDRGELFDSERHLYTFENQHVATQFAGLNDGRKWNPTATRAQLADKARWPVLIAILLLGLFLIVQDLFH